MNDDGPTPQIQPAPKYLRDFGTAPHHQPSDPAIYLPMEASVEEQRLVENLDRHAGSPAPVIHIAKIAVRVRRVEQFCKDTVHAVNALAETADPRTQHALEQKVSAVSGMAKRAKRWVAGAAAAAAAALAPTAYRLIDHSQAQGAETQKVLDLGERVGREETSLHDLQTQLFELQRELARRSSREPLHPGASSLVPPIATALTSSAKGILP